MRERFPLGASVTLEALEGEPYELLAALREAEPVSWLPALDGWLVTRRDLAVQAMRDAATFTVDDPRFSTAQVVGPSMLSLDGAAHARHRDPFARAFRLDAVRSQYTAFVTAEVDTLIDGFAGDGRAELRRGLAGPLAVAAVARSLGLADADAATVLAWYDAIVDAVSGVTTGRPVSEDGRRAFDELRASVEATLAGPPGATLLGEAAAAGLAADEVVANAAVIMFGGIETTEGMIASAALHVLATPSALADVRADPALLGGAVEESLRLEPAAAVIDRYATAAVELGGAPIRRGDLVRLSLTGANRDPAVFPEPDRFDLHRGEAKLQVAFAHGPHVCPGMHLARLETRIALERLLARLPDLRIDPERPSAVRGLVFRKPQTLHVLFDAG